MENRYFKIDNITLVRAGAVATALGILAAAGTLLAMALSGAMSLLGIAIVGTLLIGLAKSTSLVGQKFENKILSLRKQEARDNPIEQMDNEYIRREMILAEEGTGLTDARTVIRTLESNLNEMAEKNPELDLTSERQDLADMQEDFKERLAAFEAAQEGMVQFRRYIDGRKYKHQYAQSSNRVRDMLSRDSKEIATNAILFDEADASVEQQYNRSFAAMEVARAKRNGRNKTAALPNNSSPTLVGSTKNNKAYVDVNAR